MKSFATVSLITLVASAAAGEIAARALHLAPAVAPIRLGEESSAYRRSDDPLLGYVLKEGFRDRHPTNIDTFDRTNSDGFRDVERSIAKPPGTTRILFLGDSVVVGNGLPGIEQTIPACLERRLRDRRVEVLNFGQGGYCTLSEVELLRVKGVRYQPDLVAVVFVNNDYEGALWAANRYGWKRPPGVNALFLQSYFFRFLCLRFDLFHFREVLGNPVAAINAAIGADNVDDGLRMLRALADERRFKPLIFVWPTFGEDRKST